MNSHGGPLKTDGAADAVEDRTPASFSLKVSRNLSAVSSLEVGGFVFPSRIKDNRFRHNFFGSPLLSEIFLSQKKLRLLANSCCFFLACVIQASRSVSSLDLRSVLLLSNQSRTRTSWAVLVVLYLHFFFFLIMSIVCRARQHDISLAGAFEMS